MAQKKLKLRLIEENEIVGFAQVNKDYISGIVAYNTTDGDSTWGSPPNDKMKNADSFELGMERGNEDWYEGDLFEYQKLRIKYTLELVFEDYGFKFKRADTSSSNRFSIAEVDRYIKKIGNIHEGEKGAEENGVR